MTPVTVVAVLECGHLKGVPASTELPDAAECLNPRCDGEREITSLAED